MNMINIASTRKDTTQKLGSNTATMTSITNNSISVASIGNITMVI